jgi:Carboxymuconolactone decarboxylase family
MPNSVYPPPSPELSQKRRALAPDIKAAFDAREYLRRRRAAREDQAGHRRSRRTRHTMPYCIKGHTKAALRHDATREELMEAIWVAAEMRAGGAYAHSAVSLVAMDETADRAPSG